MKFRAPILRLFLTLLTVVLPQLTLAAPLGPPTRSPIMVQDVDIRTWPSHLSADQVLDILIELINGDPQAKLILDETNKKLNQHNINHLREIFSYCENDLVAKGGVAYFSQRIRATGARVAVPGHPLGPWQDLTQDRRAETFSSKIIKTHFLDYLVVAEKPSICVHPTENLYQAYEPLVHEMTHFLLIDNFESFENLLSANPLPDETHAAVMQRGGELDAFKIGSAAGIRFLKKYRIREAYPKVHDFFDEDGTLRDEEGLKNNLIESYSKSSTKESLQRRRRTKLENVTTQLHNLTSVVTPIVLNSGRSDLRKQLADEIAQFEKLKLQLSTELSSPY